MGSLAPCCLMLQVIGWKWHQPSPPCLLLALSYLPATIQWIRNLLILWRLFPHWLPYLPVLLETGDKMWFCRKDALPLLGQRPKSYILTRMVLLLKNFRWGCKQNVSAYFTSLETQWCMFFSFLFFPPLQTGVNKLADLVGVTLGPKGRNVVLESKYGPPKIVNDGVTVAKEVHSTVLWFGSVKCWT